MDFGECSQMIVTLYETGMLGPDQRPAQFIGDTLKGFAAIREDSEFDMVWAGVKERWAEPVIPTANTDTL